MLRMLALCYSAGSLGALVQSAALHLAGASGLHHSFGIALAPGFSTAWLFPRLVWGGILGMLFAIPLPFRFSLLGLFGITVALSCLEFFVVFPQWNGAGYFGLHYGYLMPFFTVAYVFLWTLTTSLSLRLFGGR